MPISHRVIIIEVSICSHFLKEKKNQQHTKMKIFLSLLKIEARNLKKVYENYDNE